MKHLSPLLRLICLLYSHVFVLFFVSCNDEPAPPPTPTPQPPHKQQDTTLHDVDWSITTFGKGGLSSSYFKDVFAISDSDVWAVGRIETEETGRLDSLGLVIKPCNAAHWDGKEWKLFSLKFKHWGSDSSYGYADVRAVFGFASDDVWLFDDAGSYMRWDGTKFTTKYISEGVRGGIEKVWGRSSNDFYLVGTNGSITHYDGKRFYLIESGTDVYLSDVYGSANGEVWTGGYQYWDLGRAFLRIKDRRVYPIIRKDNGKDFRGGRNIWISRDTLYADVGIGVYVQSINDSMHWRLVPWQSIASPLGYIRGVRGTADNNIFFVGDFGSIVHYNGKSCYVYPYFSLSNHTTFYSVAVHRSSVWCVGVDATDNAIIYHGVLKK